MTADEFSNAFDIMVSSYRRFKDFDNKEILDSIEFNEYEKSYYLTKAQEEIVTSLYNGRNQSGDSFEGTEELRRYLSNIVMEKELRPETNSSGLLLGIGSNSKFFTMPEDLWYITYEAVHISDAKCNKMSTMDVFPVTQDDYNRTKRNPFRGANDRRALRLDLADGVIEIICKYNIKDYYIRYLRKPKPIVLDNMPNHLTINGVDIKSDFKNHQACELHEAIHKKILERAVAEALQSKFTGSNNNENNKS